MTKAAWVVISLAALALGACTSDADTIDDEEQARTSEAMVLGFDVAPSLAYELKRINATPTGKNVVDRARARGLHTIKVGPLAGATCGLYTSNGVITIESPNNEYTFQRLAHELLHASGNHPHYFPDKGLIGDMCRQANAVCPSWD